MQHAAASSVPLTAPKLPTGGGTIHGMGETMGQPDSTGMTAMTIPLPISEGRGFAPNLSLKYSSGNGNSTFGIGWATEVLAIRRRTNTGTPLYTNPDSQFIGPGGNVLEPERSGGKIVTTHVSTYLDLTLDDTYEVTRYYPRIEGAFNRIERWIGQRNQGDFWLIHDASGVLHCLGKTSTARIADPVAPDHIAEWLEEEALSADGQHISFEYLAETSQNLDLKGVEQYRDHQANRYLSQVSYGNAIPYANLYLFDTHQTPSWLFSLVLDYGQRGVDSAIPPPFAPQNSWPSRPDPFSHYRYGFEVRCHRLCHQVLMFHHFANELGADDTLVTRLLLEYDENPVATRLVSAQLLAYEPDQARTLQQMPPLEFEYNLFDSNLTADWENFADFPGLINDYPYQLVDLYGEGLPGLLYRVNTLWCYRSPTRNSKGGEDGVTYPDWHTLDWVPALQPGQMRLADFNGDGHLDWMVNQPGINGYFSIAGNGAWSSFIPFDAMPVEFFQSEAKLATLVGAGLADLVLVGPKAVRLYANNRAGFDAGIDVSDPHGLPIAGRDSRELVVFADILGSGQPHLIRVQYNEVMVWPNLGRGSFGQPFVFAKLPFDEISFNPNRIYMADLDGSGAVDLLYVQNSGQISVHLNKGGNGYSAPVVLPMPAEVNFDDLCQLSAIDVQGMGVTDLVLTVPHPTVRHWRCSFSAVKPYLLNRINNNIGLDVELTYRSSAQEWLDEKSADTAAVSKLPFPVQILVKQVSRDEISGNVLSQAYTYRKGMYDGREREFRGFGFVEFRNTETDANPTSTESDSLAAPQVTRTWYHTGFESDEKALYGEPYQDQTAYPTGATRLTQWDSATETDIDFSPTQQTAWWLYRSLKGSTLRHEIYGLDDDGAVGIPFSVSVNRYQLRLVQPGVDTNSNLACVSLPLMLEQKTYTYEKIASDYRLDQHVLLQYDQMGAVLWDVGINYPRRPKPLTSPYPASLPATTWTSSYDDQQQTLRLHENLAQVWNLLRPQQWRLAMPGAQRANVLNYPSSQVPAHGLNYENLTAAGGLLDVTRVRIYAGQTEVIYLNATPSGMPDFLGLVDHTETAELDSSSLLAYDGVLTPSELSTRLAEAGYVQKPSLLPTTKHEPKVWVAPANFTEYHDAAAFYLPRSSRSTTLVGKTFLNYDKNLCVITESVDAMQNKVALSYDYRFLMPMCVVDANQRRHEVQFDALGRVVGSTYYKLDGSTQLGFKSIAQSPVPPGLTVEQSVNSAGESIQQLAIVNTYAPLSWMGTALLDIRSDAEAGACREALIARRMLTPCGHLRLAGKRWLQNKTHASPQSQTQAQGLVGVMQIPIHSATLTADSFPNEAGQQVRVSLVYADGFGRALQHSSKVPPGLAWQVDPAGKIVLSQGGQPQVAETQTRWAVSGRTEYNAKGQPLRTYQPYFINDWSYVVDSSMRACGYADTTYYDAIRREVKVVTALNYQRLKSYYPWFVVSEDENDTYTG